MYTRRGAVHELQSRLASDDLPVVAEPHQALAELARTDIQYVADLAAAALRKPPCTSGNDGRARTRRTASSGCSAPPSPAPACLAPPTTGYM